MPSYKFSSAYRWVKCTGAPIAEENSPKGVQSTWAAAGEDFAKLAEVALKTGGDGYPMEIAPYVEFVRQLSGVHYIERKVDAPIIHPECRGIPDAVADTGTMLVVGDLKMGYRPVAAKGNKQLVCGAAAYLTPRHERIRLFISQPTLSDEIDIWEPSREELLQHIEELKAAANTPAPRLVSGAHCLYCRALLQCDAARDAALTAAEVAGTTLGSPGNIGREIRILRGAQNALKTRLAALEAMGVEMARNGDLLEGLDLKPTMGRRSWDVPEEAVVRLGDLMGIDVAPRKLVSPAQAEAAGLNKEYVRSASSAKVSGYALVNQKNATEIFK